MLEVNLFGIFLGTEGFSLRRDGLKEKIAKLRINTSYRNYDINEPGSSIGVALSYQE